MKIEADWTLAAQAHVRPEPQGYLHFLPTCVGLARVTRSWRNILGSEILTDHGEMRGRACGSPPFDAQETDKSKGKVKTTKRKDRESQA